MLHEHIFGEAYIRGKNERIKEFGIFWYYILLNEFILSSVAEVIK